MSLLAVALSPSKRLRLISETWRPKFISDPANDHKQPRLHDHSSLIPGVSPTSAPGIDHIVQSRGPGVACCCDPRPAKNAFAVCLFYHCARHRRTSEEGGLLQSGSGPAGVGPLGSAFLRAINKTSLALVSVACPYAHEVWIRPEREICRLDGGQTCNNVGNHMCVQAHVFCPGDPHLSEPPPPAQQQPPLQAAE